MVKDCPSPKAEYWIDRTKMQRKNYSILKKSMRNSWSDADFKLKTDYTQELLFLGNA